MREGRREKGEGRREKGEGRREKGEGRREKGEGRREKREGRRRREVEKHTGRSGDIVPSKCPLRFFHSTTPVTITPRDVARATDWQLNRYKYHSADSRISKI